MIKKPHLPPKAGYVEVELPDGSRAYKPTKETRLALEAAEDAAKMWDDMDSLTVDHEYRITLLELGVI